MSVLRPRARRSGLGGSAIRTAAPDRPAPAAARPGARRWARPGAAALAAAVGWLVLLGPVAPARAQDPGPTPEAPPPEEAPAPAPPEEHAYHEALEAEAAVRRAHDEAVARAAQLGEELARLEGEVAAVEAELAVAQGHLDGAEAGAAVAAMELATTDLRLALERQRLRDQAVEAYMGGSTTPVPDLAHALVSPDALGELGKSKVYAAVVVADRQRVIEEVVRLTEEAAQRRAGVAEARAEARASRDEVGGRAAELEARRADRAATQERALAAAAEAEVQAVHLEERRREEELRYASLHAASDSIAEVLARTQRDQLPREGSTYGIFLNPIAGGKVVSPYGMRHHPILATDRMHAGLDLDGEMGEALRASADGVVVMASEQGGYGLVVVIDHGDRLATVYAHMSSFAVAPGDQVRQGDVIGAVGSTGLSTGPHCHWEVRVQGMPVDGTPYLRLEDPAPAAGAGR